MPGYYTQPYPDEYAEYEKGCLNLLREFAKFYQPQGPAHGHHSAYAVDLSQKIHRFVALAWKPEFVDRQFPQIRRKGYPRYDPNDPKGN